MLECDSWRIVHALAGTKGTHIVNGKSIKKIRKYFNVALVHYRNESTPTSDRLIFDLSIEPSPHYIQLISTRTMPLPKRPFELSVHRIHIEFNGVDSKVDLRHEAAPRFVLISCKRISFQFWLVLSYDAMVGSWCIFIYYRCPTWAREIILEFLLLVINDIRAIAFAVCTLCDMCYFTVSNDKFSIPRFLGDAGSRWHRYALSHVICWRHCQLSQPLNGSRDLDSRRWPLGPITDAYIDINSRL